jgi:hypothetical protein
MTQVSDAAPGPLVWTRIVKQLTIILLLWRRRGYTFFTLEFLFVTNFRRFSWSSQHKCIWTEVTLEVCLSWMGPINCTVQTSTGYHFYRGWSPWKASMYSSYNSCKSSFHWNFTFGFSKSLNDCIRSAILKAHETWFTHTNQNRASVRSFRVGKPKTALGYPRLCQTYVLGFSNPANSTVSALTWNFSGLRVMPLLYLPNVQLGRSFPLWNLTTWVRRRHTLFCAGYRQQCRHSVLYDSPLRLW